MRRRDIAPAAFALGAALVMSGGAGAHPHVWVTARAQILYTPDGNVTGVRHAWTFDEAYSTFAVQGLDKDKDGKLSTEELAPLAKVNVESLHEFGFFTRARANGAKQGFTEPVDYSLAFDKGMLTLTFTLPLKAAAPARRSFGLEVFDETYFVSFGWAEGEDAVTVANAPAGCKVAITRPKTDAPAQQQSLDGATGGSGQQPLGEDFFNSLAGRSFGAQLAHKALVACP